MIASRPQGPVHPSYVPRCVFSQRVIRSTSEADPIIGGAAPQAAGRLGLHGEAYAWSQLNELPFNSKSHCVRSQPHLSLSGSMQPTQSHPEASAGAAPLYYYWFWPAKGAK